MHEYFKIFQCLYEHFGSDSLILSSIKTISLKSLSFGTIHVLSLKHTYKPMVNYN